MTSQAELIAGDSAEERIDDDLLASLAAIAADVLPVDAEAIRRLRDEHGGLDRQHWKQIGSIGWLGLNVPESCGGSAAGEAAAAVIARQVGLAGRPEPFVVCGPVVAALLTPFTGHPATDSLLAEVSSGETVAVGAWPQAPRPFDHASQLTVKANRSGGGVVVDGEVQWLPVAQADVHLVLVDLDGEPAILAARSGTESATINPAVLADGTTAASLHFTHAVMPAANVLACGDGVLSAIADAVDVGTLLTAVELEGACETMFRLTLDYVRQRQQFGHPIGAFQAIQHRMVDMWMQLKLVRAANAEAIRVRAQTNSSVNQRRAACSSAKYRATTAARFIGDNAVQLHGAIGFTDEYILGYFVNRALVLAAAFGNARQHAAAFDQLIEEATDGCK